MTGRLSKVENIHVQKPREAPDLLVQCKDPQNVGSAATPYYFLHVRLLIEQTILGQRMSYMLFLKIHIQTVCRFHEHSTKCASVGWTTRVEIYLLSCPCGPELLQPFPLWCSSHWWRKPSLCDCRTPQRYHSSATHTHTMNTPEILGCVHNKECSASSFLVKTYHLEITTKTSNYRKT